MNKEFWLERWQNNEIGFHRESVNPMLVRHIDTLNLKTGSRLFLPLCGKTLDIHWLFAQGYYVLGAELSQKAVEQLFDELGVAPEITPDGAVTRYQTGNITIYVGDIFALEPHHLGRVDAIYDRGALVAIPLEMRIAYSAHLRSLTRTAPQLLLTLTYDDDLIEPPPFSVTEAEIKDHYHAFYRLNLLEKQYLSDGLKGEKPMHEYAWQLSI